MPASASAVARARSTRLRAITVPVRAAPAKLPAITASRATPQSTAMRATPRSLALEAPPSPAMSPNPHLEGLERVHPLTQLVGNAARLGVIADHAWGEQDQQLRARLAAVRRPEGVAQNRDPRQNRHADLAVVAPVPDQAAQGDGLAVLDGDRALNPALVDRRRQPAADRIADLLLELQRHHAAGVDARPHPKDDPGVDELNGVDQGVV